MHSDASHNQEDISYVYEMLYVWHSYVYEMLSSWRSYAYGMLSSSALRRLRDALRLWRLLRLRDFLLALLRLRDWLYAWRSYAYGMTLRLALLRLRDTFLFTLRRLRDTFLFTLRRLRDTFTSWHSYAYEMLYVWRSGVYAFFLALRRLRDALRDFLILKFNRSNRRSTLPSSSSSKPLLACYLLTYYHRE